MAEQRSVGKKILIGVGGFLGVLVLIYVIVTQILYQSLVVPTESMQRTVMVGDRILADRVSYREEELPERGEIIIFRYPGDRDQVEPAIEQRYMDRCVAVSGDMVEVRGHVAYVNGVEESFPPEGEKPSVVRKMDAVESRTFPRGRGFHYADWGPMRVPKRGDVIQLNDTSFIEWQTFIQREGHTAVRQGERILVDGVGVQSYRVERNYVFGLGDNRSNSEDSRFWGFIPVENIIARPVMVYMSMNVETDRRTGERKSSGIRWGRIGKEIE